MYKGTLELKILLKEYMNEEFHSATNKDNATINLRLHGK